VILNVKDQSPQCIHHAWLLAKSPSPFFLLYGKKVPGKKDVGIWRVMVPEAVLLNIM